MATIHFKKSFPAIEVEPGTLLMKALLDAGMPVASSCKGDGICGKCRIEIVSGAENLSQINGREAILRDRLKVQPNYRISCQTQVMGDVTVDTTYW